MVCRYGIERAARGSARAGGAALLALVCMLTLVLVLTAPIDIEHGMLIMNSAYAEQGEQRGNNGRGNGHAKDGAPGQNKAGRGGGSAADPEVSIGADSLLADGGGEMTAADAPVIDRNTPPANVDVIREITGLEEDSALSEEEELEAIRNGWGSWRTADAPGRAIR